MKGGWTCKRCADDLGLPFNGMASAYGYCKAGHHHVQQTIRWAKDLEVDREPVTGNPVCVVAQMVQDAGGTVDREATADIERQCDELVPLSSVSAPSSRFKRGSADDPQGSLF